MDKVLENDIWFIEVTIQKYRSGEIDMDECWSRIANSVDLYRRYTQPVKIEGKKNVVTMPVRYAGRLQPKERH